MTGSAKDNNYPGRIILTDDPLRAKMLVAHHLEYSKLVHEKGELVVYSGSYKQTSVAVVSTGLGCCGVIDFFSETEKACLSEIIYIGECASYSKEHTLRSVVLAEGGDLPLLERALKAASVYNIPVSTLPVIFHCGKAAAIANNAIIDDGSGAGGIVCRVAVSSANGDIVGDIYSWAKNNDVAALSVLTVTENIATAEIMEDHERHSRLYNAAHLAFETTALEVNGLQ